MSKIVHIGRGQNGNIFCKIELDNGKLSITGVEGPKANGDARGACGQIILHSWGAIEYAPGWDAVKVQQFREVWDKWHLNDMQAGSPAQTAFLVANPVTYRLHHYEAACANLADAGLNPDPGYIHNGKPYQYGSAWLRVDVPADALDFLESLPASDLTPAWV